MLQQTSIIRRSARRVLANQKNQAEPITMDEEDLLWSKVVL